MADVERVARRAAITLITQAVVFGISLAFVVVPSSAVFLDAFGPGRLPFVYLAVAVAGTVGSAMLDRAQRRRDLFGVGACAMACFAAISAGCWVLIGVAEAELGAAVGLVLFALLLQFGFVIIGAQAGRVFDVHRIKRTFPRIVAGFVSGFMLGGVVADPFVRWTGDPVPLLLVAAVAMSCFGALVWRAGRLTAASTRSQGQSDAGVDDDTDEESTGLRRLLGVPLVAAVFVYQLLSSTATQLVEYLLYERADDRFDTANELATFMGRFTAGLNLVDLVVLVTLGGVLMARYGLRFGVFANPLLVTALLAAAVVVSVAGGTDSSSLFWLIVIARVTDLTIADAATRTSVNATFQALPADQRLPAQIGVEGAGVPLALGLTAGLVLALNAITGSDVVAVIAATVIVCVLWCAAAVVVFRRYRRAIAEASQRGFLDPTELDVADPAAITVMVDLLERSEPADASVARVLPMLTGARDARAIDALAGTVARGGDAAPRALEVLADTDHQRALDVATRCLADRASHGDDTIAAALDVMFGSDELGDRSIDLARDLFDDGSAIVRGAAVAATVRRGDVGGVVVVVRAATEGEASEREWAAGVIERTGSWPEAELLGALLADSDQAVRAAAAEAVNVLTPRQHDELLRIVAESTARGDDRAERALSRVRPSTAETALARLDRARVSPASLRVESLRAAGPTSPEADDVVRSLIDIQVGHLESAIEVRSALADALPRSSDDRPAIELLDAALLDEVRIARTALVHAVGIAIGSTLTDRVAAVIDGAAPGDAAIAVEAMELELGGRIGPRVARAVRNSIDLEPSASDGSPISDLERSSQTDAAVARLVDGPEWAATADWLQACALLVWRGDGRSLDAVVACGPVSAELVAT